MSKRLVGVMTPEQIAKVERAFRETATVLQTSQAVLIDALDTPRGDSLVDRAAKDKRSDPYELSRFLIFTGEDHLVTFQRVLESGLIPTFALYSLLRSAAEAAVLVAYLFDEEVDEKHRLGRAFNLELADLREQNKFDPDDDHLRTQIAALEGRAAANGLEVYDEITKQGRRRVTGFGDVLPKQRIELFKRYLGVGEMIYRYLSAHVHATNWVKISKERAIPVEGSDLFIIPLAPNFDIIADTALIILRLHEQNVKQLIRHAGYPDETWPEAKKGVQQT